MNSFPIIAEKLDTDELQSYFDDCINLFSCQPITKFRKNKRKKEHTKTVKDSKQQERNKNKNSNLYKSTNNDNGADDSCSNDIIDDDNDKDTNDLEGVNPMPFIAKYFENVVSGENILFRNFSYITQTDHNIDSFILQFQSIFQSYFFDQSNSNKITGNAFLQLLCLLCPNFPSAIIDLAIVLLILQLSPLNQQNNGIQISNVIFEFKTLAKTTFKILKMWGM